MPDVKNVAKNSAYLAAILVAAMYIVNWAFTAINMAPKTLFLSMPTPISPITSTIGTKIMNMLAGVIPITFDIPALITLWISAFAVVFVGSYAISYGLPVIGKTRWAKVVCGILYGAAAFYLLIAGFKLISIEQAIGVFIYTIPAAMVAVWIGSALNLTDKF